MAKKKEKQPRKNARFPEYSMPFRQFFACASQQMWFEWPKEEPAIEDLQNALAIALLNGKINRKQKRRVPPLEMAIQWFKKNWKRKYIPQPVHLAAWRAGIVGLEAEL